MPSFCLNLTSIFINLNMSSIMTHWFFCVSMTLSGVLGHLYPLVQICPSSLPTPLSRLGFISHLCLFVAFFPWDFSDLSSILKEKFLVFTFSVHSPAFNSVLNFVLIIHTHCTWTHTNGPWTHSGTWGTPSGGALNTQLLALFSIPIPRWMPGARILPLTDHWVAMLVQQWTRAGSS